MHGARPGDVHWAKARDVHGAAAEYMRGARPGDVHDARAREVAWDGKTTTAIAAANYKSTRMARKPLKARGLLDSEHTAPLSSICEHQALPITFRKG